MRLPAWLVALRHRLRLGTRLGLRRPPPAADPDPIDHERIARDFPGSYGTLPAPPEWLPRKPPHGSR